MSQPQAQPRACPVCHKRGAACKCGSGAEYGIFNDEGCLESGFYSEDEAHATIAARYPEGDDYEVHELCPDHEEQPRHACEHCDADDDESEPSHGGPCKGCGTAFARCGEHMKNGAVACCPECDHT